MVNPIPSQEDNTHVRAVQGAYSRKCVERDKDSLQALNYLSTVNHKWKIRSRIQRTGIGKYSWVNRSIADWNQLPRGAIRLAHGNAYIFKTRVREI